MGKIKRFVPYELEDLTVIIPHAANYTNRWEWFWPRYVASVPEELLRKTIIILHDRSGGLKPIPSNFKEEVKPAATHLYSRRGMSLVWPTLEGLSKTKDRLIARVADDVEFRTDYWAQDAVTRFNQEPHIKVLGTVAGPGPKFGAIKKVCYAPWMEKLLNYGDYRGMSYIHGSLIIANRIIWMGCYLDVENFTRHDCEDVYFTLLIRADDIPIVKFGGHFLHRGISNKDRVSGME